MEAVLQFLTGDAGRIILSMLGGILMKKAPTFKNKAIPFVTLVANILLALASGLFPGSVHADGGAAVAASPWYVNVLHGAATWAISTGLHSGPKNLWQWVQLGAGFAEKATSK